MRVTVQVAGWWPAREQAAARPVPGHTALLVSLAAHAAAWLVIGAWTVAAGSRPRPIDWSAYGLDAIRLRVSDPLYLGTTAAAAGLASAGNSRPWLPRRTRRGPPGGRGRTALAARRSPAVLLPELPVLAPSSEDLAAISVVFAAAPQPPMPVPGSSAAQSPKPPIRIQHPINAVYEVVIAESARGEPAAAWLAGDPVYRVYLPVGAEREWVLQFCLNAERVANSPNEIQAGEAVPLTPPYPAVTIIPDTLAAPVRELALRGVLSAGGSLSRMAAIDPLDPLAGELLPMLAYWRFRPALRGGQPVDVDVLLTVPRAPR